MPTEPVLTAMLVKRNNIISFYIICMIYVSLGLFMKTQTQCKNLIYF